MASFYEAASRMPVEVLTTISPSTNEPILTRDGLSDSDVALLPAISTQAFNDFRLLPFQERQAIVKRALKLISDKQDVLAKELTEQMGRPIAYTTKEITTAVARGEYLLKISKDALKDTEGEPEQGFKRYIRKTPIGPVLILFAWNVGHRSPCSDAAIVDNSYPVSIPHPSQFFGPSSTRRQFRHSEAFTSDPYSC